VPIVVQSLWIGDRLSTMEQLCIRSFQRQGHVFHLYVYQKTAGVPEGTITLDGNEILPQSRIFTYKEHNTYAGFANFFRYKLLLEKGGWFVDADMVCLKPFGFQDDYVFSSESVNGRQLVNLGAMKVPPGSPVMRYAWEACEKMNTSELKWSQCGPTLLHEAVGKRSLEWHVKPAEVFCPVHFSVWEKILDPSISWEFGEETHAIHLWNELWRRSNQDKNATYAAGCLYEQLKQRYLP
jgi:mannosyltransferase OCH1-like enzyme